MVNGELFKELSFMIRKKTVMPVMGDAIQNFTDKVLELLRV